LVYGGEGYAFFLEVLGVVPVGLLDVFFEPVFEEVHDFGGEEHFAVFEVVGELIDAGGEISVGHFVGGGLGIAELPEVVFFGGEVFAGIMGELGDEVLEDFGARLIFHRLVQIVDHINEFLVLLIDFLDVDL